MVERMTTQGKKHKCSNHRRAPLAKRQAGAAAPEFAPRKKSVCRTNVLP